MSQYDICVTPEGVTLPFTGIYELAGFSLICYSCFVALLNIHETAEMHCHILPPNQSQSPKSTNPRPIFSPPTSASHS
jgi:hypothetical protein